MGANVYKAACNGNATVHFHHPVATAQQTLYEENTYSHLYAICTISWRTLIKLKSIT